MSTLDRLQMFRRKAARRLPRLERPLAIEALESRQLLSVTVARPILEPMQADLARQDANDVSARLQTAADFVHRTPVLQTPQEIYTTRRSGFAPLIPNPSVAQFELRTAPVVTGFQPEVLLAEAEMTGDPVLSGAPLAVPALASHPNAAAKIYLDFDGHFEPVWGGYRDITTPVFSLDSDLTTFSSSEIAAINTIWAQVAEDYAPFNIDVTTIEPASFANRAGLRVAIGGSSSWYGSAGGVAYVGTWTNSIVNTVYVFPQQLANNAKTIAEASSHETGHAFGLRHQSRYDASGTKTEEYHTGGGDWAPIMGNSYSKIRTTWHNGTSTSSTTYQDDMALISSANNSFGYRADDHGDLGDPTALSFVGSVATAGGVVQYMDDQDASSFSTSGGDFVITLDVATVGANLDSTLGLRTAAGTLIASANPSTSYGATITTALAAGHYVLIAGSAGQYGSVGQYTLTVEQSNPQPIITLDIAAASISEAAGLAAATATVTRNDTDTSSDLVVTLTSSDPSEIAVPATVVIPTGQSSATFSMDAIDDAMVDGIQTVQISAAAPSHVAAADSVNVTDDDVLTLSLFIDPGSVSEGAGLAAVTATVTRNDADTSSDLVVTLTNSDPSEIVVPLTVTIPSGESSATFSIDAVDDLVTDQTQAAAVTAAAASYVAAGVSVEVTDDDDIIEIILGLTQAVVINGHRETYDLTTFAEIEIDGGPGRDTISITGVGDGEAAALEQGRIDVFGINYAIHAASVEHITVEAWEGSTAQATLVGSSQSNRLYGYADYAMFTDRARTFSHRVDGFGAVTASSALGSRDYVFLYDSPADDTLTGVTGQVTLNRADGWSDTTAIGFTRVYVYATGGGDDTAKLSGSGDNSNRFYSYAAYSILTDSRRSFYYYANGFESVTATVAGTGTNSAYFHDSDGDDHFSASPTEATMARPAPGSDTTAIGFGRVYAYATRGGVDTAYLTGSDFGNRLRSNPTYTTLTDGARSFYDYARGFQQVTAIGSQTDPSGDTATFYDSPAADLFVGRSYWGELRDKAGATFHNRVEYFDRIYAYSRDDAAVDDTIDIDGSLVYQLIRSGTW